MSVFSLVLILVAILAAVVLLFPVAFRLDFRLTESGFVADLSVFKKKLWNYTKEWKAKDDPESDPEAPSFEPETSSPEPQKDTSVRTAIAADIPTPAPETSVTEPEPQTTPPEPETPNHGPETPQADPHLGSTQLASTMLSTGTTGREDDEPRTSNPEPEVTTPEPEAKKSLTEREFWTLVLTPDIDERGMRYGKKILSSFVNIFQVRFRDCYVEGIRMDYKSMGYGAALNAMLKGYPFLEDWDLRMDWTRDHDLQSAGHIEATINLCRTLWFLTVSSVYGGIFAFVFWRRRASVLKTGQLPELGCVRKKILNWLVEE